MTPGPLRLFMACLRRGRLLPSHSDISGNKVNEQVTEYSNLWFSWGRKIPNKLMNLKPDIYIDSNMNVKYMSCDESGIRWKKTSFTNYKPLNFGGPENGGWTEVGTHCKLGGSDSLTTLNSHRVKYSQVSKNPETFNTPINYMDCSIISHYPTKMNA